MGLASAMKQRNDALATGGGGFASPTGPPPGAGAYASPTGPPPGAQAGFAAPTGAPPGAQGGFAAPTGAPPGAQGGFAAPTGPPPGHPAGGFVSPAGPPQAYQAPAPVNTEPSLAQIMNVLKYTVADQGIQPFYPATQQGRLEGIANHIIQTRAVSTLAARWRIPVEKALEFTKLALFDIVLFLDDSGSMRGYEDGARIEDLKVIVNYVAFVASLFDADGIEVRFLNASTIASGVKNEADVQKLIDANPFKGVTNLGKEMWSKVLDPLIVRPAQKGTLQKPVLVISITDGEPYPEPAGKIREVIKDTKKALKKSRYGEDALSLQFAQVGNDKAAQDFLEKLDNDSSIGGLVDVTSNYEWEQAEIKRKTGKDLSPEDWLLKLLLGAVDTKFDAQDGAPIKKAGKFKKFFS
ncbi:hypothetical protein CcaverHIS002_0113510 [Cutaneotrichosporon cavernicola]|uniref:VWFA domain-containing protein n=1 Tax=Cutaneotrichosporon cavernicola TaxID=279322 RepID=A0AA48I7Q3_9TREE|nr:uncharacterized protein CcaverHIS019_0113380 [Cutaneotrichosporon cavernicola]BEI80822.1 hypothetical protein CcaverHIS002_0113510 [Cutaneotrichosporon cavernicola]BEI88620.1 hypothetical protein CcaverHIS019_0113380 [Cutaneotrichosporon cavernicola]BEI96393.1 hypothetical protein CcaverHIS631_0113420 [Cutaneotrichosporon cavernicola]BEJ04165.1 hypothetical protein CcaverHIS641_0113400 [Cutaneotrichosporon cavernicola]